MQTIIRMPAVIMGLTSLRANAARDRNVLIYHLRFRERMTSDEISRIRGLRVSASLVRSVIRQVIAWIKKALEDER